MAKKRAKAVYSKIPLQKPGDAFLMTLEDGRFGVCRVIRWPNSEEEKRGFGIHVLAASSPWIGKQATDSNDPRLREILVLNLHAHKNGRTVLWVSDQVPDFFRYLGVIEPKASE
jgi:hypothetical protein